MSKEKVKMFSLFFLYKYKKNPLYMTHGFQISNGFSTSFINSF